jgi:hypothetical protein
MHEEAVLHQMGVDTVRAAAHVLELEAGDGVAHGRFDLAL